MGRSPCCDENGLKKGPWTPEEDQKLVHYIQKHGHGSWRALPKLAGLNRCGKSCRLRWTNYLRPDIKRGKFSPEEEQTILNLHSILGNKWSAIAGHLPGRTDNEIKNFWNTHLKKKLIQMGFDPMTHRPRTDIFNSLPQLYLAIASLVVDRQQDHAAAVRLQAEEAAAQIAKAQYLQCLLQSSSTSVYTTATTGPAASVVTSNNNNNSLQIPNTYHQQPIISNETTVFSGHMGEEENNNNNCNTPDQTPLLSPNSSSLPPLTDVSSIGNPAGDSFSTSSYGGGNIMSSFWPDHLLLDDDAFISDFA